LTRKVRNLELDFFAANFLVKSVAKIFVITACYGNGVV